MNNRKTIKYCNNCQHKQLKSSSSENRPLSSTKSTIKTLVKRNNILKQENQLLKHNSFIGASHNPSILRNYIPDQHHNCSVLQDKLFQANKTLQDTILNLDAESQTNMILQLKVTEQDAQIKRLQHQRNALLDEMDRCRFKFHLSMAKNSHSNSKIQVKTFKGTIQSNDDFQRKYNKLMEAYSNLLQKYEELQELNSAQNLLQRANEKMSLIERNITKIQENNQEVLVNLNQQYQKFKQDVYQYFKNTYCGIKSIISTSGQIRNFRSMKQQTYRNLDFKSILQKFNISKMVIDLLNSVVLSVDQQTQNHQNVMASVLANLQNKFNKVAHKYNTMIKIMGGNPCSKSKQRRFSQINNQNINNSNRLQHSFY